MISRLLAAALALAVMASHGGGGTTAEAGVLMADDQLGSREFVVRASFDGVVSASGSWHPDDNIAVGPDSVLLVANQTLTLRTKSGAHIASMRTPDFFGAVRASGEAVGDPRLLFDGGSQRFFYVADGKVNGNSLCAPGTCVAHHLLAVSKTPNPSTLGLSDWHLYALDRTIYRTALSTIQTTNWGDGDIIAANDAAVIIKWHAYAFGPQDPSGSHQRGAKVRILDKAKLIRGEPITSWIDIEMVDPASASQWNGPITPAVGSSAESIFLLGRRGCDFVVWALDLPLSGTVLTHREVRSTRRCGGSGPAMQPEGAPPLLTVNHLNNVAYDGKSLWYAHSLLSSEMGGQPTEVVRWVQIDLRQWPGAASLVQDGLFGEAGVSSFSPAIMADRSANVAIVFARSSTTEFPSLYFTSRLATDTGSTLRPAQRLQAGTATWIEVDTTSANIGANRYVDYFGAALDPSDDSIWLFGAYAKAQRDRRTWVANVVVPGGEPGPR